MIFQLFFILYQYNLTFLAIRMCQISRDTIDRKNEQSSHSISFIYCWIVRCSQITVARVLLILLPPPVHFLFCEIPFSLSLSSFFVLLLSFSSFFLPRLVLLLQVLRLNTTISINFFHLFFVLLLVVILLFFLFHFLLCYLTFSNPQWNILMNRF